jgi:hypothetical protein
LPVGTLGSEERNRLNAFARLGAGTETTSIWIEEGGVTYRLDFFNTGGELLGDHFINMGLELHELDTCLPPDATFKSNPWKWQTSFHSDHNLNEFLMIDGFGGLESSVALVEDDKTLEPAAGLWPWQDAEHSASCTSSHPFTGQGWEGNYDSGQLFGADPPDTQVTNDDYCLGLDLSEAEPLGCSSRVKPVIPTVFETSFGSLGRVLDRGDMVPFDWTSDNGKAEFLRRLAPSGGNFGISSYFADVPDADGLLQLENATIKPLLAIGPTPLGKSILDTRCWYQGEDGSQKCRETPFLEGGWAQTACTFDPEFGCRRVFFIVVSDGDDNCGGENQVADVASLFSNSGIHTWAVNVGGIDNCKGSNQLGALAHAGRGECVTASNKAELSDTLSNILGEIREEVTAFASAAVPTIRADVEQTVIVSSFVPLNEEPIWGGSMDGFLKPLPLTAEGRGRSDGHHADPPRRHPLLGRWSEPAPRLLCPGQGGRRLAHRSTTARADRGRHCRCDPLRPMARFRAHSGRSSGRLVGRWSGKRHAGSGQRHHRPDLDEEDRYHHADG